MVTHIFSRLRLTPGAIGAGGAANVRIFPSPGLSGGSVNSWRIFFSLPLEPPGGSILGSVVFFLFFFLATVSFFLATVSRNERALVTLTQLIGRSTDQDSPTIRRRGATVKQPLGHRYRNYLRKTRFDEASVKFWLCVGDRWVVRVLTQQVRDSDAPSKSSQVDTSSRQGRSDVARTMSAGQHAPYLHLW